MRTDKFWKLVEKFKIIIEIISALIVITPVIVAFGQQRINQNVPAWLVLVSTALALFVGYFSGKRSTRSKIKASNIEIGEKEIKAQSLSDDKYPIEKIRFDYRDSPLNRNWRLTNPETGRLIYEHVPDNYWGNLLELTGSLTSYGLDYSLSQDARIGTKIEFVTKYGTDGRVYVKVWAHYQSLRKSKSVWLKFTIGLGAPKYVSGDADYDEWEFPCAPVMDNGFSKFIIDLNDAIKKTVGQTEECKLESVATIRLRGSQKIVYISVYK